MKRLFLGLALDEAARAALASLHQDVAPAAAGAARKVRWVRPESLHLTLKFLGATTDAQLEELGPLVQGVAAAALLPPADLHGLGAFPSPNRPRILYAAVRQGSAAIADLSEALEAACEPLGFAREARDRHPHVTVARVDGARPGAWEPIFAAHGGDPFGGVVTGSVVLYESAMQRGGSVYTPLLLAPTASSLSAPR